MALNSEPSALGSQICARRPLDSGRQAAPRPYGNLMQAPAGCPPPRALRGDVSDSWLLSQSHSSAWLPGHRFKANWGLRRAAVPAAHTGAGFILFSTSSQGSAVWEEPRNSGQCAVFRGWGCELTSGCTPPSLPGLALNSNQSSDLSLHASPPPPTATPNPTPKADMTVVIIIYHGYCPVSALE